jgi:hypothetical protein
LVPGTAATYHRAQVVRYPALPTATILAAPACNDVFVCALSSCEVEVNRTLIVPEFDPQHQPLATPSLSSSRIRRIRVLVAANASRRYACI